VLGCKRAAIRKLNHELGVPESALTPDDLKYTTRMYEELTFHIEERIHYSNNFHVRREINSAWYWSWARRTSGLITDCLCLDGSHYIADSDDEWVSSRPSTSLSD
jgi:hypothetical protein